MLVKFLWMDKSFTLNYMYIGLNSYQNPPSQFVSNGNYIHTHISGRVCLRVIFAPWYSYLVSSDAVYLFQQPVL